MVSRGWGLVYGGGRTGLMGAIARAVKTGGGHVVGVIPEFMKARELAYDEADELVTVRNRVTVGHLRQRSAPRRRS